MDSDMERDITVGHKTLMKNECTLQSVVVQQPSAAVYTDIVLR